MDRLFVAETMGVSFSGKRILTSASVWVGPAQITAILGRNGSGKTTLFRAALGLLRSQTCTVRFRSRVYLSPRLWELANLGLFYLPDSGLLSRRRTLAEHLTVLRERFPEDVRASFPPCLLAEELMDKTAWEMSGGEERRAEMALAWTRRPACLLADEPLAGLAPKDKELVSQVIRTMASEGCAVLLTGHDVHPLLELADQIIWMAAGTTHGLGSPKEARHHDQFRREYLGPAF